MPLKSSFNFTIEVGLMLGLLSLVKWDRSLHAEALSPHMGKTAAWKLLPNDWIIKLNILRSLFLILPLHIALIVLVHTRILFLILHFLVISFVVWGLAVTHAHLHMRSSTFILLKQHFTSEWPVSVVGGLGVKSMVLITLIDLAFPNVVIGLFL